MKTPEAHADFMKECKLIYGYDPEKKEGFVPYLEIGPGWFQLVEDLTKDLIAMGWDRVIYQIKEKFGGLRFYTNPLNVPMDERIKQAEELAAKTCDQCGKEGKLRDNRGWWRTLCDEHDDTKGRRGKSL